MQNITTQTTLFPARSTVSTSVQLDERLRLLRKYSRLLHEEFNLGRLVGYGGNKTVPFLSLYRYKEAFGLELVKEFIRRFRLNSKDYIFDPFAGMGTTLFASMIQKIPSVGVDKFPVAVKVAKVWPQFFQISPKQLASQFDALSRKAHKMPLATVALDVKIMQIAFPKAQLTELRRWKSAIDTLRNPWRDIFHILFFSILDPCSYTSKDGQFLRLVLDKKLLRPADAMRIKVAEATHDLGKAKILFPSFKEISRFLFKVYLGDTRALDERIFAKKPTAIITSPPYVNRYDYTRSYALELCFHFVKNFNELKTIRFDILRSHIESKVSETDVPPHPAVAEVVKILQDKKDQLNNPRIPLMLTAYFVDMEKCIAEWYRVLGNGAKVAVVIDNVRFEGEMVPVDLILCDMAENAGFKVREIIVARYKGNSSQQMKKYGRVPVRESILVWEK